MKIAKRIVYNIIGKGKKFGGKNDWDGDGIKNKKDCQPRNTMRQDLTSMPITDRVSNIQEQYYTNPDFKPDYQENMDRFIGDKKIKNIDKI